MERIDERERRGGERRGVTMERYGDVAQGWRK